MTEKSEISSPSPGLSPNVNAREVVIVETKVVRLRQYSLVPGRFCSGFIDVLVPVTVREKPKKIL